VILLFALLIGCICGLRSMTAPALVAWGAHLGWLHLEGSRLAFFAHPVTLLIFSLFAIGELIADKLPFIPARIQAGPLGVRILFAALCATALCISGAQALWLGAILGVVGAVLGAFAGYAYRRSFGGKVPDLLLALLEDLVAVGGGFLFLSRL
jgi:uncharacterized membrane protein